MSKKKKSKSNNQNFVLELYKYPLIEKSKKGYTFKIPGEKKIVKVFFKEKRCQKTYNVLLKLKNYKEFPNVYHKEGNLFVMDEMKGIHLKKYIKANGLTEELCEKIMILIEKMKKLKFARIDMKLKNIYIDESGNLTVMPYKNSLTKKVDYPMNLCKGFRKMGIINEFLDYLKVHHKNYYDLWAEKVKKPLEHSGSEGNYAKKEAHSNKEKSFKEKFKDSINYGDFFEMRVKVFDDLDFVPFK